MNSPIVMNFTLKGMEDSPILFNRRSFMLDMKRDPSFSKSKGEDDYAYQMRVFKLKAEYDSTGHIIMPAAHIKKCFVYSQTLSCHPIAPRGVTKRNANLTKVLPSLFVENLVFAQTAADLDHFDAVCCIQNGMKKSSVITIRPMLKEWAATLTITTFSDLVGEAEVREMLEWSGLYGGLGDWRPERQGTYGRFTVC